MKYKTQFAFLCACFRCCLWQWVGSFGGDDVFACLKENYGRRSFPRNYADDFTEVLSAFFLFFFSSQNRPRAGSWRWKMSRLTTFERFILQRWCTFITVTSINDILSCKLEMHQECFFFYKQNKTVNRMCFISWNRVLCLISIWKSFSFYIGDLSTMWF